MVRTLGRIPKILEYETHTKHSSQVVVRRFGGWRNLPLRILEYMRAERLEEEWKDVFEVILTHLDPARRDDGSDHLPTGVPSSKLKVMRGQPMYGTPLLTSPLSCAPINELGVVFLFGAVAREMGFVVTRLQQEFPAVPLTIHLTANDAPNAKVGSLEILARSARYEVLLVNDGDIESAPPDAVR